jgi:peptide/nickel transport system permease protein
MCGLSLFAGFIAPYDYAEQDRQHPFAPPTRVRFVDAEGHLHLWPFIYGWASKENAYAEYEADPSQRIELSLLVRGGEYKLFGFVRCNRHLFGVPFPARIFLLGTDGYGRDQFSRMIWGGRISFSAGLVAAAATLGLGMLLGTISGYFGGLVDSSLMRVAEVFLAVPWLYLLFAVRAFLPLHISPSLVFLLLVGVIGIVGWARPARLVRGVVLAAKQEKYVLASRGLGAGHIHILRRHILPQTTGVCLAQAALLIPQYILAEVTLSFLGLGVAEPAPSWGNMLASLQQYHVLASYWWMLVPSLVLIPVCWACYTLADFAHEHLES